MPDVPLTITAFTAETDTWATVTEDLSTVEGININQPVALTATGGDPDAMAAIDGQSPVTTGVADEHTMQLGLDLSAVNVEGLTATAVLTVPDPEPATEVTLTDFSAANPTIASASAEDVTASDGKYLTLTVTEGHPPVANFVNGKSPLATKASDTTLSLDLDLSPFDTETLAATATVSDVQPEPPPAPDIPEPGTGNHFAVSMSPGTSATWHPTPGVGGMRVDENPDQPLPVRLQNIDIEQDDIKARIEKGKQLLAQNKPSPAPEPDKTPDLVK